MKKIVITGGDGRLELSSVKFIQDIAGTIR